MISKVAILFAVVAVSYAVPAVPVLSNGLRSGSKMQDAMGNYAFNYEIADGIGATNTRSEMGDASGNKMGSYSLTDIDGRTRRVDYVADGLGFRAIVNTNEPGTALSAPASAAVVSSYAVPAASIAAAPDVAAAPILGTPVRVTANSNVIGHGNSMVAPFGIASIPNALFSLK